MSDPGKGHRFANEYYGRETWETKGTLVGKLYAYSDSGEGEVTLSLKIDDMPPMWKVDVIRDWIGLLQAEHDRAYEEMNAQFESIAREAENEDQRTAGA